MIKPLHLPAWDFFDSSAVFDFTYCLIFVQDEALVQVVRDFFEAATDTVACSVAWEVLCYLYFSQYHEKLQEEIDYTVGMNNLMLIIKQDMML